MLHYQPNARPVHPRCATLDDANSYCTCETEWCGWDGSAYELDHAIKMLARVEARRRGPGYRGSKPDEDEAADSSSNNQLRTTDADDLAGFWKDSEFLATCAKCSTRDRLSN